MKLPLEMTIINSKVFDYSQRRELCNKQTANNFFGPSLPPQNKLIEV